MKPIISWEAPEFKQYKKGKIWFIVFGLIVIGLIILAFFWKAFTMIVFLLLAGFLVAIYALKEPRLLTFSITHSGIKVDDTLYNFSDIDSFWIFYEPPEIKEISLKTKRTIFPYVYIPLGKTDPNQLRKVLLKYLSEEKQKISLIDNLARQLRF